jgi:hypothetical protein
MADLSLVVSLTYEKNNTILTQAPDVAEVDLAGDEMVSGVLTVTEAAALAIPLGPVSTAGLALLTNLDDTNYIEFGEDDTGFVPRMRILPGVTLIVDLTVITAPQVKAHTADCLMRYTIFEA